MNRAKPFIVVLAAVIVVMLIGWQLVERVHLAPARALKDQIASANRNIDTLRDQRRTLVEYERRFQTIADATLGDKEETVVHRLRTTLSRLGEEVGLSDVSVTTGQRRLIGSPAKVEIRRANPQRNDPDLIEQEGTITGVGTLEQAMRLVHRIESEPWKKRIDDVRLDPRDNGDRVSMSIRVTTFFLHDYAPAGDAAPSPYDDSEFLRYVAFAHTNPFRIPPPPTPPPVQREPRERPRPPDPPVAPPFPYHEWVVTGLAAGSFGPEVWLRRGNEARRLAVGERLNDLEFLAYVGDQAEFQLGESRFYVGVGRSLGDRRLVNQ